MSNAALFSLTLEVRPSPAVSKRSVRSISPHRPSDSEDEDSTPSRGVPVVADVHEPIPDDVTEEITAVHTSPSEDQQQGNNVGDPIMHHSGNPNQY